MKNYSELTDIDTDLHLQIELEPVGSPDAKIMVNDNSIDYAGLSESIILDYRLSLLDNINIDIILSNKHYTAEYETAVIIRGISIDNIKIIPKYTYMADYTNDHSFKDPTNYLGFNGKWTLTIDRPFYQWLHQAQNQGWLIG